MHGSGNIEQFKISETAIFILKQELQGTIAKKFEKAVP